MRCIAGPLRVTLDVDGGEVTRVHTQVGGKWRPTELHVTDLGVVPGREASAYFFSLVPRLETSGGKDRLLLPAVLADDAEVTAPLLALARDESRARSTRSQAIQWLGLIGEFAVLRTLYPQLESDELKESVFAGMAQDESAEGGRWILDRVRDEQASTRLRRSALFWAGQREATPTAELVRFYRDRGDTDFREHAIFVLSQRQDDAATDALIDIAKHDSDTRMRGKALFWLAQKNDPRVRKLIADLVLKEDR
jgi:HEAT repeat protein